MKFDHAETPVFDEELTPAGLQCPYCAQKRMTRLSLAGHIRQAHVDADFVKASAAAERQAELGGWAARDEPVAADRTDLTQRLTETGANLARAGRDIADLRDKTDATLKRLEALDAQIMDPATVRRATLNQVWDRLHDAGDIEGATIVMRMLGNLIEGDWS